MIDQQGFRLNVGIVLMNNEKKLFWGKRAGPMDAWQFPQGGLNNYETLEETMYRELREEIGLMPEDVKIVSITQRWLYYRLPRHLRRRSKPFCIGQKQKWFLLQLVSNESHIDLNQGHPPEFDSWKWVDYWYPLDQVIAFKRHVYEKMLQEFAPLVLG